MVRRTIGVALVAAATTLAACGGDDPANSNPDTGVVDDVMEDADVGADVGDTGTDSTVDTGDDTADGGPDVEPDTTPDVEPDTDLDTATDPDVEDTSADTDASHPELATLDDFSAPARAAIDAMIRSNPELEGVLWNYAADLELPESWIVQSPYPHHWGTPADEIETPDMCPSDDAACDPDFGLRACTDDADCIYGGTCEPVLATVVAPGGTPRELCVGHSDAFYDELYSAMIAAESWLDFSSLSAPTERHLSAIRNAMTYLDATGRPVVVRMLFGNIIANATDVEGFTEAITRDIEESTALSIYVGAYRIGVESWNHSKIVATDGVHLFQGGHNLWTRHYLTTAPVHDLSMRMSGSVAGDASRFLDEIWVYTCEDHTFSGYTERMHFPSGEDLCPPDWAEPAPAERPWSGGRVVALSRMGELGENPSDGGQIAMINAAQDYVYFSIQDVGPPSFGPFEWGDWPQDLLAAIARAAVRGVDVRMVVSNPNSVPGDQSGVTANYGIGWTAEDVATAVMEWLVSHPEDMPVGGVARNIVCDQFSVAPLRFNDTDDTWPGGANMGNHSKFFLVDGLAFYIGSQNLYAANLAEFGVIVDDPDAATEIIEEYWGPLWTYSSRAAVSGPDAPGGCTF